MNLIWIMSFTLLFWLAIVYFNPKLIDNKLFTFVLALVVSALLALFMFR